MSDLLAFANQFFLEASNFVWVYIISALCVIAGIYTTVRLAFIQFRCVPHALDLLRGRYEDKDNEDGITTFQALATALSGTTGIGTIAGVAIAIKLGGPGAIFWMWVMALLGMALKFVEATLGSLYRTEIGPNGEMGGGPMHYIVNGLGERWRPVAIFYALCTAVACIGAWNMFQANQAAANLESAFSVPTWLTGAVLTIGTALVLVGGISRIGKVAARLVPSMCIIYVTTIFGLCIMHYDQIPAVMTVIVTEAFDFESAGGGVIGSAILIGVRRAIFSNEAGTGSAAIAHAAAHTNHPVRQGIAASIGPFIDTLVVCAATAFVIILSGFYGNESHQNNTGEYADLSAFQVIEDSAWSINTDNSPADDHPLQRFTTGKAALHHSGESNSPARVQLESLQKMQKVSSGGFDGIRFSAHSTSNKLTAKLLDPTGAAIATAAALPSDEWGSWIIPVDQEIANQMLNTDGAWQLQFSTDGSAEVWIDRIELVENVNGIVLSSAAFAKFFGAFGNVFIPIAALFFAYTTILAGNYYGEVACQFLNSSWVKPYLWIYIGSTFVGCVLNLELVINFSDFALGLMTIPNLIAMMLLTPVVAKETHTYLARLKAGEFAR
ncbi:MAG: alanine/glycine:cation symporter family protein [Halioglobus sp.]